MKLSKKSIEKWKKLKRGENRMTEIEYAIEGIKLGMCIMGLIVVGAFALKEVLDEFKKPIDRKAQQERLAYLEAKRQRWEDYFLERKMR